MKERKSLVVVPQVILNMGSRNHTEQIEDKLNKLEEENNASFVGAYLMPNYNYGFIVLRKN
jgi:hypothetical protein